MLSLIVEVVFIFFELTFYFSIVSCGLYFKHIMIINDDSSVINKFETSLTDDTRVIIYNHHMFILQATGVFVTARHFRLSPVFMSKVRNIPLE